MFFITEPEFLYFFIGEFLLLFLNSVLISLNNFTLPRSLFVGFIRLRVDLFVKFSFCRFCVMNVCDFVNQFMWISRLNLSSISLVFFFMSRCVFLCPFLCFVIFFFRSFIMKFWFYFLYVHYLFGQNKEDGGFSPMVRETWVQSQVESYQRL